MIYCSKRSARCVKSFRITPGDDLLDKCWGGGASLLPDFLRGGLSLTYWELSRDEEFFLSCELGIEAWEILSTKRPSTAHPCEEVDISAGELSLERVWVQR